MRSMLIDFAIFYQRKCIQRKMWLGLVTRMESNNLMFSVNATGEKEERKEGEGEGVAKLLFIEINPKLKAIFQIFPHESSRLSCLQ